MDTDKQITAQLDTETKFQQVRNRVAEISQYASELDNPQDIMAMLEWLEGEQKELIEKLFKALSYGKQMKSLYQSTSEKYSHLSDAVAFADLDHPAVEKLWDEAADEGQKNAITGLMMRIAIGSAISPTDAGAILNALERPDSIQPAYRDRIAQRLRALADQFDTQTEQQKSA